MLDYHPGLSCPTSACNELIKGVSGGDLATQLARWGRLGRDRARFYAAEICEGLQGLHLQGVIYRLVPFTKWSWNSS